MTTAFYGRDDVYSLVRLHVQSLPEVLIVTERLRYCTMSTHPSHVNSRINLLFPVLRLLTVVICRPGSMQSDGNDLSSMLGCSDSG